MITANGQEDVMANRPTAALSSPFSRCQPLTVARALQRQRPDPGPQLNPLCDGMHLAVSARSNVNLTACGPFVSGVRYNRGVVAVAGAQVALLGFDMRFIGCNGESGHRCSGSLLKTLVTDQPLASDSLWGGGSMGRTGPCSAWQICRADSHRSLILVLGPPHRTQIRSWRCSGMTGRS